MSGVVPRERIPESIQGGRHGKFTGQLLMSLVSSAVLLVL